MYNGANMDQLHAPQRQIRRLNFLQVRKLVTAVRVKEARKVARATYVLYVEYQYELGILNQTRRSVLTLRVLSSSTSSAVLPKND